MANLLHPYTHKVALFSPCLDILCNFEPLCIRRLFLHSLLGRIKSVAVHNCTEVVRYPPGNQVCRVLCWSFQRLDCQFQMCVWRTASLIQNIHCAHVTGITFFCDFLCMKYCPANCHVLQMSSSRFFTAILIATSSLFSWSTSYLIISHFRWDHFFLVSPKDMEM